MSSLHWIHCSLPSIRLQLYIYGSFLCTNIVSIVKCTKTYFCLNSHSMVPLLLLVFTCWVSDRKSGWSTVQKQCVFTLSGSFLAHFLFGCWYGSLKVGMNRIQHHQHDSRYLGCRATFPSSPVDIDKNGWLGFVLPFLVLFRDLCSRGPATFWKNAKIAPTIVGQIFH